MCKAIHTKQGQNHMILYCTGRKRWETAKRCPITRCALTFFCIRQRAKHSSTWVTVHKKQNAKGYTAKRGELLVYLTESCKMTCCCVACAKRVRQTSGRPANKVDDDVYFKMIDSSRETKGEGLRKLRQLEQFIIASDNTLYLMVNWHVLYSTPIEKR